MTTEKQTPEALAAECKRLAGLYADSNRKGSEFSSGNLTNQWRGLCSAIDRLAALASATSQQEPEDNAAFDAKVEEVRQWLQHEQAVYLAMPSVRKLVIYAQMAQAAPPVQQAVKKETP